MFIDTHCHVNMMIKKKFDTLVLEEELDQAQLILDDAQLNNVSCIVNVGTSLIESENVIKLAKQYNNCFAVIGIHPVDAQHTTHREIKLLKKIFLHHEIREKIIGIGECGFDFYHQGLSKQKQEDFFVSQIEIGLETNRAIIVHSRNAYDETLEVLERYKKNKIRGIIHCFSYDQQFADIITSWGFYLGIGGTITYPKNQQLRDIVTSIPLSAIVLETDAPFLPIQAMRGKTNHPKHIKEIAEYIAQLKGCDISEVEKETTKNSKAIFKHNLL